MHLKLLIATIAIATVSVFGTVAQVRLDSCEYVVKFPLGQSSISVTFADNAKGLAAMDDFINRAQSDEKITIQHILVKGSSSPDGNPQRNQKLSEERCEALADYIRSHHQLPENILETVPGGIAWTSLYEMVLNGKEFEGRKEALVIIADNSAKNILSDTRRQRLMKLYAGRTWNFLNKNYFPILRNASSIVITYTEIASTPISDEKIEHPVAQEEKIVKENEETVVETVTTPVAETYHPLFAITTNLLYDIAAVPNIGIEIPIGEHFSVKADWMYAWWSNTDKCRFWRIYGGDLGARYYFGVPSSKNQDSRTLNGHHVGLLGQMVTYDFEWEKRGYQAPRWQYGGSVEYGYSLPIARQLNLDFGLSLGYISGKYSKYTPESGHFYEDECKTMHYFGLTSAQVSLVWLVNINKKGGAR